MMRRIVSTAVTAVVALIVLAGCAIGTPALSSSVAAQLQSGVKSVATAAASGDYSSAASKLAALQSDLNAAEDANHVDPTRALQIQALIDRVKADLAKLAQGTGTTVTPSPTPTPTVVTPPGPTKAPKPGKPGHGHGKDKP
jgi:hypothetical protein